MKATYQKPELTITEVELQSIMAGSGLNSEGTEGETKGAGSGDASSAAGNGNFTLWDDDYEE